MKKLSLKFLLVLAIFFMAIAAGQFASRSILFKNRLDQDVRRAGRMIFAGIQRRENRLWESRKQAAMATGRLFGSLLAGLEPTADLAATVQSHKGTANAGQSPKETSVVAQSPAREKAFRYRIGDGEDALGIFTPGVAQMPLQALSAAAAFPEVRSYFETMAPAYVSAYFISKDNWIAAFPARKALGLADDLILLREPFYTECSPSRNPQKEARFSSPRYDRGLSRWVVSATVPVYIDGGFQGVAGHDIPLEPLLASLDRGVFVMDSAFRLLLHQGLAGRLQGLEATASAFSDFKPFITDQKDLALIEALKTEKSFPAERLSGQPGEPLLLLTWQEQKTGWHYVFTLGAADMFAATRRGELTLQLLNALVLLLGLFLLYLFLHATIAAPLGRIGESRRPGRPAAPPRATKGQPPQGDGFLVPPRSFFAEIGRISGSMQNVFAELRQQTAAALEAKENLEKLMQTSQSIVITTDRLLHPTFMNEFGLKKLQMDKDAVPTLRARDYFERNFMREAAAELKKNEHIAERETTLTLRTGEKIDVALSLSKIRDAAGRIGGFLAVVVDISKRKKAEIDLKNQILFSRQIFQSIPEMILIVDRRLRVTFINKRARDLIPAGAAGAIIGQNLNNILSKNSIESGFDELVRGVLEGGTSVHRINTLSPVLENESYVDLIVEPLKSGGIVIGGIIMLRDISEWRGLTAQLRSLQNFMQKLINASPYAVVSINEHGLITTWNSAAEKILGVPFGGAFGKQLFSLLPLFDKYKDAINEVMILKKTIYLNDEQIFIGEEDFKVANLTLYPVTAEQSGVVIHIEDVSALKQLESSLIHAQKMESLGLLTSHIIHDFNNLLSGIMGYASLLEKKISDNPKLHKYVQTIITSSERASTLINQLLNFSRKKMAEKEVLNLNDLIKETLDFLAMNLKPINLDIQLNDSQILLQADKTKMSQVLINLFINARDALENVARPIIRLRSERVEISNQSGLLDGAYAQVEISDNGSGISHENQKRIFEPFFTTKGLGRGTGLGLAIVREIIQDFNGRIEVNSDPGQGTTFTILLPICEQEALQTAVQEKKAPNAPLEGLVLLIDDEEVVREIGSDMLKSLGLNCLTATNGAEGIEVFKKNAAEITLIILDVEMPGITGEKVFQILRELRPEIKILVASGYGREYLETEIFKGKISHYMPKPFKIEQLSYQVNRILGGRDA